MKRGLKRELFSLEVYENEGENITLTQDSNIIVISPLNYKLVCQWISEVAEDIKSASEE